MKPGVTTYLDGEQPLEALKVGLVSNFTFNILDLPNCLQRRIIFRGLIFSDEYWIVLTYVLTVPSSRFNTECLFCFLYKLRSTSVCELLCMLALVYGTMD
jgi:hypothetical protein